MILETYFNSKLFFFVKNTLYNFNQNIDNENFYMAEEHVWYDVGCPSRNGIVNLVILVLLIIICFPTLSISLLLCGKYTNLNIKDGGVAVAMKKLLQASLKILCS